MRILFLDFDGVLHPYTPYVEVPKFCWLHVLDKLLSTHKDVRICVHSTWRYEYRDEELRELLGSLGDRFFGSTPRGPREQAIQSVLQANKAQLKDYLVLDDARDEFTEGLLNVTFLDGLVGISDVRAQAAVAEWLVTTAEDG